MSKRIRSLVCMVMSVVLLLSMNAWSGGIVSAEGTAAQPRFSYTAYTFTGLNITTAGVAACTADVEGYDGITTKIHIKMNLQQYLALQWTTIASWQGTFNGVDGVLAKTKTLTSSGRYRVQATYTVYSGSAYEKITGTSQEDYFTKP